MSTSKSFNSIKEIAKFLRKSEKKSQILFAYNTTGKTRLSIEFKNLGKNYNTDGEVISRDTFYFNAFTEDLFYWENDLENDSERKLHFRIESNFFNAFHDLSMEEKIQEYLHRYCTFNFIIDYENATIRFFNVGNLEECIKISRSEERLFISSTFLSILELVIDNYDSYNWVKYIFIDDPVSSLDDNNIIAIAHDLATIIKNTQEGRNLKFIISTHHALFFNVLFNSLSNANKYFYYIKDDKYIIESINDSPFFYHISMIRKIKEAIDRNELYTYHFNILRSILEKTANFHGFRSFSECIKLDQENEDRTLHSRMINILSHGNYSIFEPVRMSKEHKQYFVQIFRNFLQKFTFNSEILNTNN